MNGIILIAFGKYGYLNMAHNMAMSIKRFNPNLNITLFIDPDFDVQESYLYDNIIKLKQSDIYTSGVGIDPAKIKLRLYDILPYEHNLYLDVDGLCISDITPTFDLLIKNNDSVCMEVIGKGGKNDTIPYSVWATNSVIWSYFKLKDTDILPSVQTSWIYIKKDSEAKTFYKEVEKYANFPLTKLKKRWGGTLPDELIYSGVFAKLNKIPNFDKTVIFYGNKIDKRSFSELSKDYNILSLYGNGKGRTMVMPKYIEWYDLILNSYGEKVYKSKTFLNDKHVNKQ